MSLRSDVLTEFLEVAFHAVLRHRGIYPRQVFALRKKYNVPVWVSKHPKVNEYLAECLRTVRELLSADAVKEVALVVLVNEVTVERYAFAVELEPTLTTPKDEHLVAVEDAFRELLLKLAAQQCPDELPPDATFAVHVTTDNQNYVRVSENPTFATFPWIRVGGDEENAKRRIVPVKTAECPLFKLNAYVEK